jgi:hypothetical protein
VIRFVDFHGKRHPREMKLVENRGGFGNLKRRIAKPLK